MASTRWEKILAEVAKLETASVKVGVLAEKGGNKTEDDGITLIELAAIHEFGSPAAGIPQRSFIRSTFRINQVHGLNVICRQLAGKVMSGDMTAARALGLLGQWGAAAVKKTIRLRQTTGPEPQELKPATIAAKGSSTPLVDTGRLLATINYVVVGVE